jgi:glycerol-3-phosphate cytidylyltransferase
MKKIITYGTYDLLHRGHVNLLKRAKAMGDFLVVGLSSDEFNAIKNKKAFYSYEERKLVLEAVRYVDLVIPEHTWEQKEQDIDEYEIDVFVMGDDWSGKFDHLKEQCEVVYLPRTDGVSTTQIKAQLRVTESSNIELSE